MDNNNLNKKQKGNIGEFIAVEYLKSLGYEILDTNYRYSRFGEIDIIAKKDMIYSFIEVKSRKDTKYGRPSEAVNFNKIKKIKKITNFYILQNKLFDEKISFDVIEIIYTIKGDEVTLHEKNLIKNAFY